MRPKNNARQDFQQFGATHSNLAEAVQDVDLVS